MFEIRQLSKRILYEIKHEFVLLLITLKSNVQQNNNFQKIYSLKRNIYSSL